jgi:dUTP pyrophosphatase
MVDKNDYFVLSDGSNVDSVIVKVINKSNNPLPQYKTTGAAGMDIMAYIPDGDYVIIKPQETKLILTGLFIALPSGWEAQVRSRSGLAAMDNVFVLNSPGTIDSDYRGEIKVILTNLGTDDFIIHSGDRIAQLVLNRVTKIMFKEVTNLDNTERGDGGFGSTGI